MDRSNAVWRVVLKTQAQGLELLTVEESGVHAMPSRQKKLKLGHEHVDGGSHHLLWPDELEHAAMTATARDATGLDVESGQSG